MSIESMFSVEPCTAPSISAHSGSFDSASLLVMRTDWNVAVVSRIITVGRLRVSHRLRELEGVVQTTFYQSLIE